MNIFEYKLGALEYRLYDLKQKSLIVKIIRGMLWLIIQTGRFRLPVLSSISTSSLESRKNCNFQGVFFRVECRNGAYYPVNDEKNNRLFQEYKKLAEKEKNVVFGGRLGDYKYYDMDKVIAAALNRLETL